MLLYSSGSDCPLNYLLQREGTIIMNLRSFSRMRVILFLAMILTLVFGAAAGEEYDSNTMRLLRHEGTVEILNPEGEPRFVLENVRFESGETLQTGEDGTASVGLDDTKIVTLDTLSRVEFLQEDAHMHLTLSEGTLFLDVQKKLDENETLDIETSTMVVGIRGTVVALSDFPLEDPNQVSSPAAAREAAKTAAAAENPAAADPDKDTVQRDASQVSTDGLEEILNTDVIGSVHGRVSTICVLEGRVTITYRGTDGVLYTIEVGEGEKAILTDRIGSGQVDEIPKAETLYREDIEGFIANQVESDPVLKNRVENASDALTKSNPVYDNEIVLTAGSAEKSFDGTGFAENELTVTAEGLPEGYIYAANASGTQIDAGSSESIVSDFAIYDNHGLNVTKRFRNLHTEKGILSVTWDEPVTLIAQSASKMYNGEPLRRTTDVLVYGLPPEYSIRVFADGSQTDAGSSPNPVGPYTIYNSRDEDVTEYFTNVEKVAGQLVVDPAKLTVWTGSAEKTYDGTPLTNPNAVISNARDFQYGTPAWRNLSYVFSEVTSGSGENIDCQTLYGICGTVWVHGTNPITGETREIELHAGQKLLVYLHDTEEVQTIEFKLEELPETELPEGILRLFADNPDLLRQSCTDAGSWDMEVIEELIAALPDSEPENMVEEAGLKVAESEAERLMTDFTNVRITIDTEITDYTDRALGHEEAHYSPVYIDETIKVWATGSQTEVGESKNTYAISWGNANRKNYDLVEKLGTLTVTEPEKASNGITLTAVSAKKTYDGTPLEASGVSVSGLPAGYSVDAKTTGSQTDAGSSASKVAEYKILNESGLDVTSVFTKITTVDGTLTVTPATLTITTGSDEKVYDGEALTNDETVLEGLAKGETVTAKATGSITEPGEAENSYQIDWGKTNPQNYILNEKTGTLKITKLELAVDLGSMNTEYTGSPIIPDPSVTIMNGKHAGETISGTRLRAMNIAYAGGMIPSVRASSIRALFRFRLFTGDSMELSVTGMGAEAGTYSLETNVTFQEDAEGRYTVTFANGTTLTVNPAKLTITTGGASKVYDGEELTCATVSCEGLVNGETITVTATGTITDAGKAENTCTIEWGTTNEKNYAVTEKYGDLVIEPLEITINMDACEEYFSESEEPEYCGYPWGYYFGNDEYDGAYAFYSNGTSAGDTLEPADIYDNYNDDEDWAGETAVYELPGGGAAEVTLNAVTDAGTYPVIPEISITEGKSQNYSFAWAEYTLVIKPLTLVFDMNGQTTTFTNLMHLPRGVTAYLDGSQCRRTFSKRVYEEGTQNPIYYYARFHLLDTDRVELTCEGPVTVGTYNFKDYIKEITFTSGKASNYDIQYENGEVIINPLNVNLYLADETPVTYDGEFHSADPYIGGYYWMTPVESDDDIPTWNVTGSIKNEVLFQVKITGGGTDAGEYPLECSFAFPNAGEENYVIHPYNKTLSIEPAPLTISASSAEKVYDGTALSSDVTVEGLQGNDTITVTPAPITNAGETNEPYTIDWGTTNKENYLLTEEKGTLKITPRDVEFDLGGRTVAWDGEAHGGDLFVYCEGLDCAVEKADDTTWTVTFASGDTANVSITGGGADAGEYTLECTYEFTKGSKDNFSINCTYDQLIISADPSPSPVPLTVSTGSASKLYDGTPLTNPEAKVDGLRHRDSVTVTATGSQTEVGKSDNTYEIDWGETDKNNYYLEDKLGTLEVISTDIPITITTGTASKAYDGTALTCDEVDIDGLPEGFTWTASANGSQTDAGEGTNSIGEYTILDMDGNDVTDVFTNITTDEGKLTVTKNNTEITVTAGSFSHEYSPLYDGTYNKYEVKGLPEGFTVDVTIEGLQYVAGTSENKITSCIIRNKDGKDVTGNFSNLKLVNGTLTVTRAKIRVWSYGGSSSDSFDTCEYRGSSYSWGISWQGVKGSDDPTPWDLEFTDKYGDGWFKDAGTHTLSFTATVVRNDLKDKYEIGEVTFGTVTVKPAPLIVITESATKTYDGTPLTAGASLSGLRGTDSYKFTSDTILPTVTTTKQITDAGSIPNSYEIDWGTINASNYTIVEDIGTLTVEPAPLTVITDSDTKAYDGTPLTAPGARLEGLMDCDDATVTATGTITDAGTAVNTYTINWGTTNPNNYTITEHLGMLSITETGSPAPLTVITESASQTYNGKPLTAGARLVGLSKNADATVTATGSITHAGSAVNTYKIDWGTTNASDYTLTENLGTLTVTKAELKVVTGSAEKTYDGTPLTADGRLEGLPDFEDAAFAVTGSITNAGETTNTYEIAWETTNPNDYSITESLGTLTVNPATLYVKTGYASKTYDGKPLTCEEASIEGLQNGETATIQATGTITDPGSAENTYEIIWGTANKENYRIEEDLGWLYVYSTGGSGPVVDVIKSAANRASMPDSGIGDNSQEIIAYPDPSNEKTEEPTQKEPETGDASKTFTGDVFVELQNKDDVSEGDTLTFIAVVKGDKTLITIHWQKLSPNGTEWEDIGTDEVLKLKASEANACGKYRVVLLDADHNVCAETTVCFPEIQTKGTTTDSPEKVSEANPEPASGMKSTPTTKPGDEPESSQEPESGSKPKTEPAVKQETETKSGPEPAVNPEPEYKPEPETEPTRNQEPEPQPEPEPEPEANGESEPEPEPAVQNTPAGEQQPDPSQSSELKEEKDEPAATNPAEPEASVTEEPSQTTEPEADA